MRQRLLDDSFDGPSGGAPEVLPGGAPGGGGGGLDSPSEEAPPRIEGISIPSASSQVDHSSRGARSGKDGTYTLYNIVVRAGTRQWKVFRRYQQFCALDAKLAGEYGRRPALPSKKLVGNFSPAFIDKRRARLEAYLQQLLELDGVHQNADFTSFLGADRLTSQSKMTASLTQFDWTYRSGGLSGFRPPSSPVPGSGQGFGPRTGEGFVSRGGSDDGESGSWSCCVVS